MFFKTMGGNMAISMSKIKIIIKATVAPAISIVTLVIGFKVSLWLKEYSNLSEPSFIIVLTFFMIFSILLPRINRLQSFSLTKGELVLQDIKETEASVKELAKAILEVTETSSHAIMRESFDREAKDNAVDKLRKLTS